MAPFPGALLACACACMLLPGAAAARGRTRAVNVNSTADNGIPHPPLTGKRGFGPEVAVAQGRLLGRTLVSTKGTTYEAYSGIPYAAPPVGELRFKGPRPPTSWPGVRDARREGRICTQQPANLTRILGTRLPRSMEPLHAAELPGLIRVQPYLIQALVHILTSGEDCLFLNVYTPRAARVVRAGDKDKAAGGLPVLFWIHGGGFVWGEGGMTLYDPDLLIDHGMVVVTFNYRLGPLGFLSLGPGSGAPGNAGIKDMAAALRWVSDNIAHFGGDPAKITVFGESAGAVGAHLLVLNRSTASLLRGVIAASGSAVHWWASVPADVAARRARSLARWVRCPADAADAADARDVVKCLRNVAAGRLALHHERALTPEDQRYLTGRLAFVPVVEVADEQADEWDAPFMTRSPRDLMAAGEGTTVPIMLGFNSGESLVLYTGLTRDPSEASMKLIDRDITCLLPDDILARLTPEEAVAMSRRIRRHYFGDEQPVATANRAKLANYFELGTSVFMYLDTLMLARYIAATPGAAPVHMYRFSYNGAITVIKGLLRIQSDDACHGDELPYVWKMHIAVTSRPLGPAATEYRVQNTFSSMIANFITAGSPTPESSSLNVTWPAFTAMEQAYLEIGEEPVVRRDFSHDTVAFWDDINAKVLGGPVWSKITDLEARRRAVGVVAEGAGQVVEGAESRGSSTKRKGGKTLSGGAGH